MIKKFRYFILALVCFMLVSAPISTMAAEGKISYLEEIQSVSTGDAQPYALMTLNEDYDVMTVADRVFSNAFPDGSMQYLYRPSYQTTVEVLSINFWTGNLNGLTGKNNIRLHLPITINGLSEDDILLKGEVWLIKDGKKYILGNYDNPWLGCILDDLTASDGASMGIDLYLMNREIYDYLYNEMWLNPDDFTPNIHDTFYDQPRFILDGYYLDELMRNRGVSRNITISYSGGSYTCEYIEKEDIGLLKSIISNIQSYGQSIIDNVTTFKNELFTKLDDIFSTDSTVISGAMDDYQSAEQEVFAPAMDSLTDFDFGSNDISSLGTGFIGAITFVSSCLSNMYDLTPFSAVFDVIATLALASICIGMSRLWFGKKGR